MTVVVVVVAIVNAVENVVLVAFHLVVVNMLLLFLFL